MGLTVSERKALIRKHAKRYRKSTKKQKGRILEEFVYSTDYSRKYAGWILRNWGTKRIVFLNDELIELVVGHLRAQGFDVAVNFPFKGAELTRRYADPAGGRHALQIEINRKLYMDEASIEKNAGFDDLQDHMSKLAKAICLFAATS